MNQMIERLREDKAMKETAVTNPHRRRFLSFAKLAGAVTVVALLGKKTTDPEPLQLAAASPEPEPSRYHETDHIRKYYKSAGLL